MRIARSKSLPMPWTRVGVRLIPKGHSANRSLSAIEPVSATAKRKLENGEQRPVPEIYPARAEIPKITGQRLGSASVTRGNVAGSHTPGNNAPETRLAGCPERIRTFESGDACQTLGRLALNFHRRKEWTSAAKRVSLSPCRGKGRLARSGILPRWRWCHCGASAVAAPGAVATEKGSLNLAQQNPH